MEPFYEWFSLSSFIYNRTAEVKWWVLWVSTKLLLPIIILHMEYNKLSWVWFLSLRMKKCACNNNPQRLTNTTTGVKKDNKRFTATKSCYNLLCLCHVFSCHGYFKVPYIHTYIKYKYIILSLFLKLWLIPWMGCVHPIFFCTFFAFFNFSFASRFGSVLAEYPLWHE